MPKDLVAQSIIPYSVNWTEHVPARTLIKEFALDQHSASVELRDFTAQHFPLQRGGGRARKSKRKQCMLTTLRKNKTTEP